MMQPRSVTVAVLLAAAVACTACGDRPTFRDLKADPSFPGEAQDRTRFDALFEFAPRTDCPTSVMQGLGLSSELRIFRGRGIGDEQLRRYLGGLQRYWSQFGIDCFTRHEVIDLPYSYALVLSPKVLLQRVKKETGIAPLRPETPEEEAIVEQALARTMLQPVLEFIQVYSTPAVEAVNVVILPRIVDHERVAGEVLGGVVVGLGLSPRLLEDAPESELLLQTLSNAGVPADFTPTAFIGAATVDRRLEFPDAVVAHELGHAYGLPHVQDFGNLMTASSLEACPGTIDDGQIAIVAESLAPAAAFAREPRFVSLSHGSRVLFEYVQRLREE